MRINPDTLSEEFEAWKAAQAEGTELERFLKDRRARADAFQLGAGAVYNRARLWEQPRYKVLEIVNPFLGEAQRIS